MSWTRHLWVFVTLLFVFGVFGFSIGPTKISQPVFFSHKIHVTDNQIGCRACHVYAEHSPVAGIPSMTKCMGCHKFVAKQNPEVQKVVESFEKGEVIRWNRVYRLPDHVHFTHERHVAAGLRCQDCHGDVDHMDTVVQIPPLTMGWCVDCHRERHGPLDCLECHK